MLVKVNFVRKKRTENIILSTQIGNRINATFIVYRFIA